MAFTVACGQRRENAASCELRLFSGFQICHKEYRGNFRTKRDLPDPTAPQHRNQGLQRRLRVSPSPPRFLQDAFAQRVTGGRSKQAAEHEGGLVVEAWISRHLPGCGRD
jgi:hypothetical protein